MTKLVTTTRTISNAGIHRMVGRFYSVKNKCSVAWESWLERDFMLLSEYDWAVEHYVEQPEQVVLWLDGVAHRYTPDVRLVLYDGTIRVVEVKTERALNDPFTALKLAAAETYYIAAGYLFQVVTEAYIRANHRLSNIKLLYRYASVSPSPAEVRRVAAFLDRPSPQPLGDIVANAHRASVNPAVLFHLMFRQRIAFDIDDTPLSPATLLSWRQ
jgi:hypothetical protein